jgi:hypothetical protein
VQDSHGVHSDGVQCVEIVKQINGWAYTGTSRKLAPSLSSTQLSSKLLQQTRESSQQAVSRMDYSSNAVETRRTGGRTQHILPSDQ